VSHNIIQDGYTKDGYIGAVPNLHDEVKFKYRPMLAEQVESLSAAVEKAEPAKAALLVASSMCKQLTEWSETFSAPENLPAAINLENVRRLHPLVLAKLRRIVEGISPGDLPPDADSKAVDAYATALEATIAGEAPGQKELVANQKN